MSRRTFGSGPQAYPWPAIREVALWLACPARGLFAAANFDPYGRYILYATLAGGQPRIGSLSADLLRKLPSVPRSLVSAARPIRREESTP